MTDAGDTSEPRTCAAAGCETELGKDNRSGYCGVHLPRRSHAAAVTVGDERAEAERFVMAWLKADYERDDVDGSWMSERSVERLIDRVTDVMRGHLMRVPRPGGANGSPKRHKAQVRLDAGYIVIGTPRELSGHLAGEPDARAPSCPAYSKCLEHVVRKGWKDWTCRGCAGPGVEAAKQGKAPGEPPDEELRGEITRDMTEGRVRRKGRTRKYEDKGWG